MLDETEWALIAPFLGNAIEQIKRYREETGCSLAEARQHGYGQEALLRFKELTGAEAAHADELWHHRIEIYGPPCLACGKPLRTPRARFCAACGARKELRPSA